MQKVQLKMHLSMCTGCKEFDKQSQIIDNSMAEFQKEGHLLAEEILSEEKKSQLNSTVNQSLD